jgi:hypothetical protein
VVLKEEIPEEFRQVCERFGYNLVHGMCFTNMSCLYFRCANIVETVAFKRPNVEANNGSPDVVEAIIGEERDAEAMDGLPASSSPQLPSSRDSDAISINSSSTDWEGEYGVTATPPPSSATAAPSPAPTRKCTTRLRPWL